MSIESEIKTAVENRHATDGFRALRSEIHAAIIEAHRQLAPGKRWSDNEVRILDIIDRWLDTIGHDRSK